MASWGRPPRPAARHWRLRGPAGCLLLVVIVVIILLMLSILFGGFQLGKKAAPLPHRPHTAAEFIFTGPSFGARLSEHP